jgi:asparagine synthetase B (glutamine-hydrolysing)
MAAFAGRVDFERLNAQPMRVEAAAGTFPAAAFGETAVVAGAHHALAIRPVRAMFTPSVFDRPVDDGRFVVVGDTRIDGRADLLRVLGESAVLTTQSSDEEIVVAAIRRWGDRCAAHFVGEFAIAAWDREERRLILARDHFGARPLYYARRGSAIAFASSTTALRQLVDFDAELDSAAVADYIVFGAPTEPSATYFRGLSTLPPAHVASVSASSLTLSRYWDYPVAAEARRRRGEDLVEELSALLRTSIEDRLRSSPASIQLSGGIDSTALAVVAHDVLGGNVLSGLTMSYVGLFEDDEPRLAREAGAFVGFPVEEVRADEWRLWQGMAETGGRTRERPGWGPLVEAWDAIHRIHSAHGPVVLVGTGGDELMVAPRKPFRGWLANRDVAGAVQALFDCMRWRIRPRFGFRSRGPRRWPAPAIPACLDEEFVRQSGIRDRLRDDVVDEITGEGLPRPEARGFLLRSQIARTFELCHPSVTGVPLFYSLPFFDRRLVESVLAMPAFPWFERKVLLRRAMAGRLPAEILCRRKKGLARDPLEAMIRAGLVDDPRLTGVDAEGLFRPNFGQVPGESECGLELWARCRAFEVALWMRDANAHLSGSSEAPI